MSNNIQKELRAYEQYQIAHALASTYTSDQLRQALEIRRKNLTPQQKIDPFDTPIEDDEVCETCTGACVIADGPGACEE